MELAVTIEGNVAVRTYPAEEELDAACSFDLFFVGYAFCFEIWCVAVQNVDVCGVYVDVREEVFVHEGVVRFWVLTRQAYVLVLFDDLQLEFWILEGLLARTILKVTTFLNEMSPALYRRTSSL